MKPSRSINIVLNYSGQFVKNILANVLPAKDFEGKSVDKIFGITYLYGQPAFIVKWKESGLFEPVFVVDAYKYFEDDARAYYASIGQPIPQIPGASTNGFHISESESDSASSSSASDSASSSSNSDSETQIQNGNGHDDDANDDVSNDLEAGEVQVEDEDSEEDLDILDLTCEDTIDWETIMSWPSSFDKRF